MPTPARTSRRSRGAAASPAPTEARRRAPSEEAIIASLAGTSDAVGDAELAALFGDDVPELRRLASARTRAPQRRGTAPRVYLLHGIMGSELGRSRRLFWDDVIWLGLGDVVLGNLAKLSLGPSGDPKIKALGFLPGVYLLMRLQLEGEGFEVVSHAYDWRRNLQELGAELRRRIAAEKQPVQIVAHSMGGLVTRAAFKQGMTGVSRFLMLATPNHGSLAPVEALRGQYALARLIAGGDLFHSAEDLARDVFGTFPGLYQMILARRLNPECDLLDPQRWPAEGPRPSKALLALAGKVDDLLAKPADTSAVPWYLVAGIDQETKVAAKVVGSEFHYRITRDGDGTVPVESALLPGVQKTWFASAGHGFFANDASVRAATVEILRNGDTSVLRTQRPDVTRTATWVQERELRAVADTRSRYRSPAEMNHPQRLRAIFGAPEPVPAPPTSALEGYDHRLEHVTIGRKTQRRLEICFYRGSIAEVTARAYVLGTFSGVTPSGAAGALDQLMGGAIADLIGHNMFGSRTGEVFILPLARREVRAEMGLFVGLGAYDEFRLVDSPAPGGRRTQAYFHRQHVPALEIAAENTARLLARTHVDDFATVLLGGSVAGDMAATGESMLRGFLRGLEDSDPGEGIRRIVICETQAERYQALRQHLVYLATTALCEGVEFVLTELDPPPEVRRLRALGVDSQGPRLGAPDPAYLLVRAEDNPAVKDAQIWKFALMGPSSRAAVREDALSTTRPRIDQLLKPVASPRSPTSAEASKLGIALGKELIPPAILTEIREWSQLPLVVLHDAEASRIPWETLEFEGGAAIGTVRPALRPGMTRRFLASGSTCSRWAATHARADVVKVLLVRNPTGDLPGAVEEAKAIGEALATNRRFVVDSSLHEETATKAALLAKLKSGEFDIVHYCGHAFFDAKRRDACGLLCAKHEVLSGKDLAGIAKLPTLLFLNACQSARARARDPISPGSPPPSPPRTVAETMLCSGIANFIGTYWPVSDAGASQFARAFYSSMLAGANLGDALLAGRAAIRKDAGQANEADRFNYILYGNPAVTLAPRSA